MAFLREYEEQVEVPTDIRHPVVVAYLGRRCEALGALFQQQHATALYPVFTDKPVEVDAAGNRPVIPICSIPIHTVETGLLHALDQGADLLTQQIVNGHADLGGFWQMIFDLGRRVERIGRILGQTIGLRQKTSRLRHTGGDFTLDTYAGDRIPGTGSELPFNGSRSDVEPIEPVGVAVGRPKGGASRI